MLTDLYLTGCLEDKAGRPHRLPGMRPDDPVLCAAFDQIHDTDWAKLILENRGKAPHVVRDQLQATGWVQVQRHRMLGLIPTTRIALYDEDMVSGLAHRVTEALRMPLTTDQPIHDHSPSGCWASSGRCPTCSASTSVRGTGRSCAN